jgi:hypothetical protein
LFELFVGYAEVYDRLSDAANIVWQVEGLMSMYGLLPKTVSTFAALHQTLLDMAAGEQVTHGTLYFTIFEIDDRKILFFHESGCYLGFMHNKCVDVLKKEGVLSEQPLLYRVYSAEDIKKRHDYICQRACSISSKRRVPNTASTSSHVKNRSSQTFKNKLNQLQHQIGNIEQLLSRTETSALFLKQQFVHVLKFNAQVGKVDHR